MTNITEIFIGGLVKKSQEIPFDVIQQARRVLLDYLGVLVGGKKYLEEKYPELLKSAPSEVFLNGFAAHVLELDDGHRYGMIHLGASIVTSVMEAAKEEKFDYKNLLRGIVMGYEVAVRCARAIQPGHKVRGYHVSGTCGTIGSAMGIAFARGYTVEQLRSTLACAVSSAAGVLEIQEQASDMKPFNLGRAAYDGVLAAQIGKFAIPGPDDVLGGKHGFLTALTDTPHSGFLTDFSSNEYAVDGIYQKVHAACRHCHPAIDAIVNMRNNLKLMPEQVDKVEVYTYRLAIGGHDHTEIKGISSAKLSTPFAVALAVVKGSAGYADYNEEVLDDYWVMNITRKVRILEDEEFTKRSPGIRGARVVLYLKDGGEYEAICMYPKGEPENPLTREELEAKFISLALYGGLSKEKCVKICGLIAQPNMTKDEVLKLVKF